MSAAAPGAPAAAPAHVLALDRTNLVAGADAFRVEGSSANITVGNASTVTTGSGTLLRAIAAGGAGSNVIFTLDAVNLQGDLVSDATSVVNASLRNGATLTGKIDPVNLALDGSSRWNVTADSVLGNLSIAPGGVVQLLAPVGGVYKSLSVRGALQGSGAIGINTRLGADGSPSDKVLLDGGSASGDGGPTGLLVTNTGGTGAVTIANGIQVVDALNGGTTAANAFALRSAVVAGPYEYLLYRGSKDGTSPQAWYLRSQAPTPPVPPTPAPAPSPAPPEPPAPTPNVLPVPVVRPLYRPEVGAYLSNQRQASGMFVHSLHDRLGDPWGLAGLWSTWVDKATGEVHESYTMLTLNADHHPLMNRMHKPERDPATKEVLPPEKQDKRSVIPIERGDVDQWLGGTVEEAQQLLKLTPVEVFDAGPIMAPVCCNLAVANRDERRPSARCGSSGAVHILSGSRR